ncbi:protein RAE1 [Tanacetum coccineum]
MRVLTHRLTFNSRMRTPTIFTAKILLLKIMQILRGIEIKAVIWLWIDKLALRFKNFIVCIVDKEIDDKKTRYWDLRQQTPVHTQQIPNRCYALSVKHPLMVVGTADRNLIAFNLQNQFKRITSLLKYQTRCVATFPDQQGFLVQHTFATLGSDGAFNFWDKDGNND